MADFDPPWAVNGGKRAPTAAEIDGGFPCGPADRALFNFLHHRVQAELNAVITGAGLTPSDADLTQVWKAIRAYTDNTINNRYIVGGLFVTFTSTTNWTVPAGVTIIRGRVWGAGGGGGGAANTTYAGTGGGGGEYVEQSAVVTPGQVIGITVGAGGAAGAAAGAGTAAGNGGNGGASSIGTIMSAAGGGGGGGATTTATPTWSGTGGTATGDPWGLRISGRHGGLQATPFGGFGGASYGSTSAGPSVGAGHVGVPAGGGGGGAIGNFAGGVGANGLVMIQY